MPDKPQGNHLKNESSPYLLQHADNPVDWYPWGAEALQKAKDENKPILLSIGYSSCHWCHVMAHESFENEEIAKLMNEYFVNIKLDREERPDIDNIYMDAVQQMGLRGGWPLNVFLTPDQKPFYGGTYFPTEQWSRLIVSVNDAYTNKYDQLYESATKFTNGLQLSEVVKYGLGEETKSFSLDSLNKAMEKVSRNIDQEWGGMNRAPKFPMPAFWNYLLIHSHESKDKVLQDQVLLTLDKMSRGGIYDQLGGGFSRYSVDGEWHVPHFEKMLYDNGQLLSLYAEAYKLTGYIEYQKTLRETVSWIAREMTDANGGFYSALDADSEGEEGKYYCWTFDELRAISGSDFSLVAEYYDVTQKGNWEDKNVLRRLFSDEELANELDIPIEVLNETIDSFKKKALAVRETRIKPGLDSKILSGWNGLALTGLCQAYQADPSDQIRTLAKNNTEFMRNKMINDEGILIRTFGRNEQGFLEDYAAVIQAFITYYETFFDEAYLLVAKDLTDQVIAQFYDEQEALFFYNSSQSEQLIARKKEIFDNVIPASNSIMAENLYRLGLLLDIQQFKQMSVTMTKKIYPLIEKDLEYLSNWATVALKNNLPTAEIVIVGSEYLAYASAIQNHYHPNKVVLASADKSNLPLFEHKEAIENKTTIYVCFDKVCQRPVFSVEEVIKELKY